MKRVEKNFIPVFALHFLMSCEALLLQDSYRKVVVHYVKTNVLGEKKGPFLPKLEDGSGSSFFPHLQRSPRKLLTLTEVENMIYGGMYYPSKSVSRKIVFFMIGCNKGIVYHS